MSPTNPIIVIVALTVCLLVTKLISSLFKIELKPVKYNSIDGLRGYLAFFVFLHHSAVYYFFLTTWKWDVPPSNLFTHFGQTSVVLFFMVTGFLFFSKLIDMRNKKMDWLHFFVSRVFRLYPLYLIVLFIMICIVYIMSGYTRLESNHSLISEIKQWLLFTVYGNPDVNDYKETSGIMASVIWSIKYEWIFYFSLPLIGFLFFKQWHSFLIIVVSILVAISMFNYINNIHFYSFIGGIAGAILARSNRFLKFSNHFLSSIIIIVCLFCSVYFFKTAYRPVPLILTSVAFVLISGGNSIFGVLNLNVSRQVGQLSYSIYLWHTTLLFILYRMIIGFETANKYSPEKFWTITCLGLVSSLLIISFITYYFVELPFINAASKVTAKIRNVKNRILKCFTRILRFEKL